MLLTLLKAKIHRARVTHTELEYEGSCAIDSLLLDASGIREFEQLQIYNVSNGERFTTYALGAGPGSGIISLNGAAAHKAHAGDCIIICAYIQLDNQEAAAFKPTLCYVNARNALVRQAHSMPTQVA